MTPSWTKHLCQLKTRRLGPKEEFSTPGTPQLDQRNVEYISHFPQSLVKEKNPSLWYNMHFYQHAAVKAHVTPCTDTPETTVHHKPSYSDVLEQREFSTHTHTQVDSTIIRQLRSVCCNRSSFVWSYLELFHKSKIKKGVSHMMHLW